MNRTNRLVIALAAMPYAEARVLLELVCKGTTSLPGRRNRLQKHFKTALVRVLKFAKHETLRKLQRYMHSHRPLHGQDAPQHSDAVRIAFNVDELSQDLSVMLSTEARAVLGTAVSDTLAAVGFRDPWTLPAQAALDFIARRQNLLSGVSDEVFQQIRQAISDGLTIGESYNELATRISNSFNTIEIGRAEVIAETETAAAYGYASDQAARTAGIQYKKWLHGATSKVPRPDHVAIHGLVVPMDQPFPVGNPPLMYPHDGNGAPEDVINCSCISIPVIEQDFKNQ